MKRIVTMVAAAVFLAGMTSLSLAHEAKHAHSHKKPVAAKTVQSTHESPTANTKAVSEPMVKKETAPASTPAPAATTAKPTVSTTPSQPSVAGKTTEKATTDLAKDKTTDAAKSVVSSTPSVPSSSSAPATAAKAVTNPVLTPAVPTK